ncbi:hypothetical protein NC652_030136 [Populus alba x Populus x berolinensis]|nr:hypothetical protein NC652_030136 [Populus alba x Populus x berolinensis]
MKKMIPWKMKKPGKIKVVEDHINEVSAERNSLKDQKPVGKREVNGFEYQIRSKDEEIRMKDMRRLDHELALKDIRRLERELAMKDEEIRMKDKRLLEHELAMKDIRRLEDDLAMKDEEMRRLKSQLDLREKEFASLRNTIRSACTDLSNAVTTADDALEFKNKSPSKKGNEHFFTEKDLYGAVPSVPRGYRS